MGESSSQNLTKHQKYPSLNKYENNYYSNMFDNNIEDMLNEYGENHYGYLPKLNKWIIIKTIYPGFWGFGVQNHSQRDALSDW